MADKELKQALEYTQRGWHVFPVVHRGKIPATEHGLKDATNDAGQIQQWFGNGRLYNIGIRTGQPSDLTVIDIDGNDGRRWKQHMIDCGRVFPETYTVVSGRADGGEHLYFKYVPGVRNSQGNDQNGIHPGVDVRSEGGYIVGAGSTHETGAVYTLKNDAMVAECPQWLKGILLAKANQNYKVVSIDSSKKIPEGGRNGELTRLAGSMRRKGFDDGAIDAALQQHNQKHCSPPLSEREVTSIARSVGKYPAGKQTGLLSRYPWTDAGAGEMFAEACGHKFRYVVKWGWAYYDGMRWNRERGEREARRHFIKYVARKLRDEALEVDISLRAGLEKYARQLEKSAAVSAALNEASCCPPILAYPDEFDSDPWALNCKNGTLCLKTGQLRPHDPADNLTQLADVVFDPQADCPLWNRFMGETFLLNTNMIDFLYRWFGYCTTGQKTEHALPIFHGSGQNGKNVLLDTICGLLGDYAGEAAPDLIIQKGRGEHPTELADLFGKRLVVCSETDEAAAMKIQLVKRLTGNRKMKARYMRQDYFEWEATHKIILVTNNLPTIKEDTHAVWRRLRRVPFKYQVPDEDVDLELTDKLIEERSGILNHLLRGCLSWQADGLSWPEEIIEATEEYRGEQNTVKDFVESHTELGDFCRCSVGELRGAYDQFCRDNAISETISAQAFNSRIEALGPVRENAWWKGRTQKCWKGIGLLQHDQNAEPYQNEAKNVGF